MSMIGYLLVAAAVCAGLAWLFHRSQRHDPMIDSMIRRNAYKPRDGMAEADHARIEQLGAKRWKETVKAQRPRKRKTPPSNVVPLRRHG